MSSIDKLLIRGIRSFSPYQENVIEFYAPLTIIVGHNGAGKTTIIECLKYATTGDLPPNAKGGAFVHDPKVSRELEVKGQIKLKFKNVRGQTMVCTRSMQSTQKRTKLEQKTLESLLATTDPATGEQVSISSRCAEMDAEIPLQLGVSRAVLENVIFCHQEDSFWPLSEPSILKKKFDDIFSATRYTKALDTLKVLRKELIAEVKLEQQKLDYLKVDREKANKIHLEFEKIEIRRKDGLGRIQSIERQLESVNDTIQRLSKDLKYLNDLQGELQRAEHDLQITQRSREDLLQGLKIMMEPDNILEAMLDQHDQRFSNDENVLLELQEKKRFLESQISNESRLFSSKTTEIGILEAELSRFTQKNTIRLGLIDKLCQELGFLLPSKDPQAIASSAQESIKSQKLTLESIQMENRQSETLLMHKKQSLNTRVSSVTELKRIKRRCIEETQRKLASVLDQINDASSAKEQLDDLQLRLLEEESILNQSRTFYESANFEGRLQVLFEQRREMDGELQSLNSQMAISSRFSDLRVKLDLKKVEFEKKREILDRILAEIKGDIEERITDKPVAVDNIEMDTEQLWRGKERQVKILQERNDRATQSFSMYRSKYDHISLLYSRKEQELFEKTSRLRAVCGSEDFEIYYEETEAEFKRLNTQITNLLSSRTTYEAFFESFGRNKDCPLCDRKFESKLDEELFSRKLSKFLDSLPSTTIDLESQRRQLEAKMTELKSLRTISDDVDRLKLIELTDLNAELKVVGEEKERAQANLDDISSELSLATVEEKRLLALKRRGEEVGKLQREISMIQNDMKVMENELRLSGVNLEMDQIQQQLTKLQEDRQKVQQRIEKTTNDMRAHEGDVKAKECRFRDAKEQVIKLQLRQSELSRLESDCLELERAIKVLSGEIISIDKDDLEPLNLELERVEEEWKVVARGNEDRIIQMKERICKVEEIFREFLTVDSDISQMINEGCSEGRLEELLFGKEMIEATLLELQKSLDETNESLKTFSKAASEATLEKRNLQDNLKYRELGRRLFGIEGEISRIRERLGGGGGGRDVDTKCSATVQLQKQELFHSELLGERSGIFGELRQLEDQRERLDNELSEEYGSIEEDYRHQFIRLNATSTAIEDLEKYSKALDQAIMKFHSYKMAEVNRIIKEIWTSTYQGADIDTIEMRADHEGEGPFNVVGKPSSSTSASVSSSRSYNYRVVMLKGEIELDMRGRSSAGQRVLASLIIRLALAETFGQHCGVLALDEPTTNLDRDNIDSLAASLAEIIKLRGRQAGGNFQLIIITHDEEFVDLLGRHECADYYWRVFKDENQYSTIERQSFEGVLK